MTNESNPSATAPAPASRTPWWRLRRRHVVPVGAAVAVVIGLGTTGVAMSAHRGIPMPSGSPPNGASAAGTHECAEATERCDGTLEVPLVWDDPDAEKITVGFSWYPRTDQSRPARGTVFVNPGGPAATSIRARSSSTRSSDRSDSDTTSCWSTRAASVPRPR
jgi:hypothetical protein